MAANDDTADIETDLTLAAGVLAKIYDLKRGQAVRQHAHAHDHISVVASGFARVTAGGASTDHGPGSVLTIPAHVEHQVRALTDCRWLCIWNEDHYPDVTAD